MENIHWFYYESPLQIFHSKLPKKLLRCRSRSRKVGQGFCCCHQKNDVLNPVSMAGKNINCFLILNCDSQDGRCRSVGPAWDQLAIDSRDGRCRSFGPAWDQLAIDSGSIARCSMELFSQSQHSVQTLSHVQSHALTSVRTLKIPWSMSE